MIDRHMGFIPELK